MPNPQIGFFEIANYAEAAVWGGMSVWCVFQSYRRRSSRLAILAVALLAFGFSDVVEVRTGAWYRPWWLLVWKGLCLFTILGVLVSLHRSKQRR